MSVGPAHPDGPGCFVAVVGASGVGKDSVMNAARCRFGPQDRVVFVRRFITRAADGQHEDHEPVAEADFRRLCGEGRFVLSWNAHGLGYGIPAEAGEMVADGMIVIANLSRTVLPDMIAAFPKSRIVEITAAPEIIAARIAGRGRESAEQIRLRIERSVCFERSEDVRVIDNSVELEAAVSAFVAAVRDARASVVA